MGFTIKFLNFCKVNIFTGGLHPQITPKKVERVFFEFLPFTTMKLCLYGVMVSFEILEAFFPLLGVILPIMLMIFKTT